MTDIKRREGTYKTRNIIKKRKKLFFHKVFTTIHITYKGIIPRSGRNSWYRILANTFIDSITHSFKCNQPHMMLYTSSRDSPVPMWKCRHGGEVPPPGKEKMCNTTSFQFHESPLLDDVCFPWPSYHFISWWFQGISYLRMCAAH